MALAYRYKDHSDDRGRVRMLEIPWDLIRGEAKDRGSYMVVLRLPRSRKVKIGSLKEHRFKEGYYVYVGSAKRENLLSSRINRHRRKFKEKPHWNIDHFRPLTQFRATLPIRTEDDLECMMADSLRDLTGQDTPKDFGSHGCRGKCRSHLFYFPHDPLNNPDFQRLVQYYRMESLVERCRG